MLLSRLSARRLTSISLNKVVKNVSFPKSKINNIVSARSFSVKKPSGYWKQFAKPREYFDELSKILNLKTYEDWYQVKVSDIEEYGGDGLLSNYGNSPVKALTTAYPEHNWQLTKFSSIPQGFWQEISNQRDFFDHVGKKLNIKKWEEWYSVKKNDVADHGGLSILQYYENSPCQALMNIYPEYGWDVAKFAEKPAYYWKNLKNHREFLDQVGKKLNYAQWEDWYKVQNADVIDYGGEGLLRDYYKGFAVKAVMSIYPERPWKLWKFLNIPKELWREIKHQRAFFEHLAQQFSIQHWEDWYRVKENDIRNSGGNHILDHYAGSHMKALLSIYPRHPWDLSKFSFRDTGMLNDKAKQRELFDEIGKKLNVKTWEDWYKVNSKDVKDLSPTLLSYFGGSLNDALMAVYPENGWDKTKWQWTETTPTDAPKSTQI